MEKQIQQEKVKILIIQTQDAKDRGVCLEAVENEISRILNKNHEKFSVEVKYIE